MERFLTGDVWKQANGLAKGRNQRIACIAYVTSTILKLRKGDELFCDASTFAIQFGETSAKAIRYYFRKGVKICSVRNLHSKLFLSDKLLIIGSANLSRNSAEILTESALATTNQRAIAQAKAFCHNLALESNPLEKEEINVLLKIKVKRTGRRPGKSTKTRRKQFGNGAWFITIGPLSEKQYETYREKDEQVSDQLSSEFGIDEDDIGFITWPIKSEFAKASKPGDILLVKFNNKSNTRSEVLPPSALLRKESHGRTMLLWYDRSDFKKEMSWTDFRKALNKLDLNRISFRRTSKLGEQELEELNQIWS